MDRLKPVGFFENPLVGRHVEINLKLIHMALGVKTHTFGRHVENSLRISNMAFLGEMFVDS